MHLNKTNKNPFEWIDILRGIAALSIVLFHSRVFLWVGWQEIRSNPNNYTFFERKMALLSIPMPFMGSGVMLFFLLSGFCIHFPFVNTQKIDLKSYAIRRFIRILPPYWIVIIFSLLIESVCYILFDVNTSSFYTFSRSFLMIQNYPPNPGQIISNPSLWSLPVEVQLYICYPLIYWVGKKIGEASALFLVGVVSLIAVIFTLTIAHWMQSDFMKYWIIWCMGALLSKLLVNGTLPKFGLTIWVIFLLSFCISILSIIYEVVSPLRDYLWAFTYFQLLWLCLKQNSPSKYFSSFLLKTLTNLGKISYSLYLVHFPLFYLIGKVYVYYYGHKPYNLLICYTSTLIAVVLAHFFYNLFELPFHKLARQIGKRKF